MVSAENSFSVTSLNVYFGILQDSLSEYVRDKMNSTSVFCFQETAEEVREVLDKLLLDDFVGHHAFRSAEPHDRDISVYVRRDIGVTDVSTIYGETDGSGMALKCELIDSLGRRVTVTNAHGDPFPGHKLDTPERLAFSEQLLELSRGSTDIQVIIGDFNLLPEAESIQIFATNGFRNLIEEFAIPTTRNELAWEKHPPEMKQLHADYAFVRGDDIDCDFFVDNVTVSDHLPMTLRMSHKIALPLDSLETKPEVSLAG